MKFRTTRLYWKVPTWGAEQIAKMESDIEPLAKQIGDFCGVADRNCAGLTEMLKCKIKLIL